MRHKNKVKGFTLAELLITVAVIAILVAISIPIFTTQLEKSRKAVDLDNARKIYSALMNSISSGDLVIGDAGYITVFVYNQKNKTKGSGGSPIDGAIGNWSANTQTSYKGKVYEAFDFYVGSSGKTITFLSAICKDYGLDLLSMTSRQTKNDWFAVQISLNDTFKSGYAEGSGAIGNSWSAGSGIYANAFTEEF